MEFDRVSRGLQGPLQVQRSGGRLQLPVAKGFWPKWRKCSLGGRVMLVLFRAHIRSPSRCTVYSLPMWDLFQQSLYLRLPTMVSFNLVGVCCRCSFPAEVSGLSERTCSL